MRQLWILLLALLHRACATLPALAAGVAAVDTASKLMQRSRSEATTITHLLTPVALKSVTLEYQSISNSVYVDEEGAPARQRIANAYLNMLHVDQASPDDGGCLINPAVDVQQLQEDLFCGPVAPMAFAFVEKLLNNPELLIYDNEDTDTILAGSFLQQGQHTRMFVMRYTPNSHPNAKRPIAKVTLKTLVLSDVQFQPFMYIEQYEKAVKNSVRTSYRSEQRLRTLGTFYTDEHMVLIRNMVTHMVQVMEGVLLPTEPREMLHGVSTFSLPASTYTMSKDANVGVADLFGKISDKLLRSTVAQNDTTQEVAVAATADKPTKSTKKAAHENLP